MDANVNQDTSEDTELTSWFINKRVHIGLPEGPLECTIIGVIDESGYMFYECLLEGGGIYYQPIDGVCGISILQDEKTSDIFKVVK